MRKILIIARREYLAAVRTKGFIIGLIIVPLMMSGSGLAIYLLKDRVDTTDKKVVLIDRSGIVADTLTAAAEERNAEVVHHKKTGKKLRPAYIFTTVSPDDEDPLAQRLELSNQVRAGQIYAFVEIGPDVLHPGEDEETSRIVYHAEGAALDELAGWLQSPINIHLRRLRMTEVGVESETADQVLRWVDVEKMGLISIDEETGVVQDARHISKAETILVPLVLPMLMLFMVLSGGAPLLSSVMEEKTQRIAEVILGSVKPFEFMMGKVLAGVGVSLTSSLVYVLLGIVILGNTGLAEFIPYQLLPWFFAYMLSAIVMFGAINAGLGAMCNEPKDAQNLTFPSMMLVMVPIFILMPVLKEPLTGFATWMSLFPTFTPILMLLRMGAPKGIPMWQPWVGLAGILLFAVFSVWAGGRIFRVAILMQGVPPKLSNIMRWAWRG